ncbi:CCA tRNA nucleotidyltransferase [Parasphingorhabdus sp.]|uniref:CCA tRNA nucleotidyltransferase n=1 Tax=Parasphingorhabdus sp. TaxID=2709688 RepID=UPI002F93E6C1
MAEPPYLGDYRRNIGQPVKAAGLAFVKLPGAPWHQRQSLKNIVAALDGQDGMVRFVGGAVRDSLLGLPVQDIDLATILKPDDVMARLSKAGIKVIPTGIGHGTVTAITRDGPVEITTLRRDVSTDGRRATVAYSDDWKEDAARRDFTINALSADPETLEIYDYFGGLEDLENRHIRFIGSARQRIAEDHLRIMRYFRFLARFAETRVDDEAYAACTQAAESLHSLSRERIADELMKLLVTANPAFAVGKMLDAGIFDHVFAGAESEAAAQLDRLVNREQAYSIPPVAIRRLITLLPKDVDKAGKIVTGLKSSKKMRRGVMDRLTAQEPAAADMPVLAYHYGAEAAQDIALLFAADDDLAACMEALDGWQKPVFPITGGDLIAMGLEPGPIVTKTLAKVEQAWIDEGFPDEERVTQLARESISPD